MKKSRVVMKMRDELLRRKQSLIAQMRGELGSTSRSASGHASDPDAAYRLVEMENLELEEIQEALDKIRDGEFGICEQCGGRISLERLKVIPYASLCVRCKRKEEQYAKAQDHDEEAWENVDQYVNEDEAEKDEISERGRKVL